jgi:hypothetical protein
MQVEQNIGDLQEEQACSKLASREVHISARIGGRFGKEKHYLRAMPVENLRNYFRLLETIQDPVSRNQQAISRATVDYVCLFSAALGR